MKEVTKPTLGNWGEWIIQKVFHPFTVFATPAFILFLVIYRTINAFRDGFYVGIRSFSSFLLPLIIVTFIFIFKNEMMKKFSKTRPFINFTIFLFIGVAVLLSLKFIIVTTGLPIAELILSGSFSLLVFSYVASDEKGNEKRMLSSYYGMVSGFLIYIIFWGFPELS
jgi:hypothetical protein